MKEKLDEKYEEKVFQNELNKEILLREKLKNDFESQILLKDNEIFEIKTNFLKISHEITEKDLKIKFLESSISDKMQTINLLEEKMKEKTNLTENSSFISLNLDKDHRRINSSNYEKLKKKYKDYANKLNKNRSNLVDKVSTGKESINTNHKKQVTESLIKKIKNEKKQGNFFKPKN